MKSLSFSFTFQILLSVAEEFYQQLTVVSVDVDMYTSWAARFVPKNYKRSFARKLAIYYAVLEAISWFAYII